MASKLALSLVIGGVVASSVGAAFGSVESRIKKLEDKGNKAKVLKSTIGETIKLRDEWKKAHDSGAAGADKLLAKFESNLTALRKQGIEVGRLGQEYNRLARQAKAADLQLKGHSQIDGGVKGIKSSAGQALALSASLAVPTKISGDYQAKIRQMALWAHIAGENGEQAMADKIAKVAADVGMGQQALAAAVGGLIEKGIDWEESVDYAPLIADLIDGQGMEGETIATLFSAFKEAGVKKEDMGAMLGQVAAAGDIGAFGPKEMARYMPSLLGTIKQLGMEGPEAVRFLGASLQSQYKQTQDSAAAATNMNNLLAAVISSTSQERFAKQGIDLAGSIAAATKSGKADNPVDAFIKLTDVLLKKQNPGKFKEVEALKKKIRESQDGSADEAQAMASLLQSAGLAGIVSDQSASAGLLAQIKYGSTIKEDMATIKATDGRVKIEDDAAKARETSNAKWATATASMEASMTRLGDAIRPLTDKVADGLGAASYALADLTQKAPGVVAGIVSIGAALIVAKGLFSSFMIMRGVTNLARGSVMGRTRGRGTGEIGAAMPRTGNRVVDAGLGALGKVFGRAAANDGGSGLGSEPQRVFVVNVAALGGGIGGAAGERTGSRRSRRRARRRAASTGGASKGGPRRPAAKAPSVPVPTKTLAAGAGELAGLGKTVSGLRSVTRLAKSLPGGNLLDAGLGAVDTAMNATTQDEKAEGYGGAAGGLAGALAGGAMGAAIGSVVPVIGTAIGGAIGAAIGSMGGESLGGFLGKKWFGEDEDKPEESAPVVKQEDPPAGPVSLAAPLPPPVPISLAASAVPPTPAISYDPRDPNSKDPFLVPALTANRVRYPGAALAKPATATETPAAPAAPAVSYDPLDPNSKDPFLVPALTANRVRFPGGGLSPPTGNVVRDMAAAAVPAPSAPELAKAAAPRGEGAKVDQAFTFSPNMPLTVQGDVKDPAQLVREMEGPLRSLWEAFQREQGARMASTQLFDAAHL